eukprot:1159755-Pelagomonas_calceolata.AAC.6
MEVIQNTFGNENLPGWSFGPLGGDLRLREWSGVLRLSSFFGGCETVMKADNCPVLLYSQKVLLFQSITRASPAHNTYKCYFFGMLLCARHAASV